MPNAEKEAPCPVPECDGGYIRVPLIVERTMFDHRERFVEFDSIPCAECRGLGRITRPLPPGKGGPDG